MLFLTVDLLWLLMMNLFWFMPEPFNWLLTFSLCIFGARIYILWKDYVIKKGIFSGIAMKRVIKQVIRFFFNTRCGMINRKT